MLIECYHIREQSEREARQTVIGSKYDRRRRRFPLLLYYRVCYVCQVRSRISRDLAWWPGGVMFMSIWDQHVLGNVRAEIRWLESSLSSMSS